MNYSSTAVTESLYIHWPFCPYKCHFCPFVAIAGHDSFMQAYHTALKKELIAFGTSVKHTKIKTIFLGGGTPSTYPQELLLDTFGTLRDMFIFSNDVEITIEVNPGTVNQQMLHAWKQVGINRLSIGVQSLKDSALKSLNRHQTAQQVAEVMKMAEPLFDVISIDLILGLPDVSAQEWKDTVSQAVRWPIKHISVYFLTIHENTPLYFKVQKKQVGIPVDEEIIPLYHWTRDFLAEHGFEQYELSNFAKPGYECVHNMVYWERKPYKGFGLGACSFDETYRFQNEKNLMKYIAALERNDSVVVEAEHISDEQMRLEKLMLGLRAQIGVDYVQFTQQYSQQEKDAFDKKVNEFSSQGLIAHSDGKLRLTAHGLLLENEIVVQLARIKNS